MSTKVNSSMRELLMWISVQERSYGEAIDAWRSACPRLSVWDDALHDGLIEIQPRGTMRQAIVALTGRGWAALHAES